MATTETRYGNTLLRIADTAEALYEAVAKAIAETIAQTLREQAYFTLALSGGNTPRGIYTLLGNVYRQWVEWSRVHLFWGDERYVPHSHPASNYRMAYETLIEPTAIPKHNVHPMPTQPLSAEEAAQDYERHLRQFFGELPRFDLILLGLGVDGHTASLFPYTQALQEKTQWVAVGEAPAEPTTRLTLTIPVLNAAKRLYFVVGGSDKAEVLKQVLAGIPLPAAMVRPTDGELVWWVDAAASKALDAV